MNNERLERLAAQMMAAMIANGLPTFTEKGETDAQALARHGIEYAKALIAAVDAETPKHQKP
jgi:hypothetical protein